MMNRNPQFTTCQNSYKTFKFVQWWYLYWRMILNSLSQLFIDDDHQPFRRWLSQFKFSALIPASSIFSGSSCTALSSGLDNFHTWDCSCDYSPGCTRTFECGERQSMQHCGLPLPLGFFCAFFMTSFHSFSIVAFASGIHIAWVEISFICASRFPEACVTERQISRIFWTLRNSRFLKSSLNRKTFGVHTSLFPCSHLRVSCTPPILRVYLKNFVSQIRCAARRDNMCLLSPSERVKWRAFLRSFHRTNSYVKL